jgi:translation initiation factor IF-2
VSIDVGLVTKNDVLMASAAGAVIIGFHTRLENGVTPLAKHHGVRIETYEIIYEMGDKVREMMADLLDPDIKEIKTGAAEVRQVFPLAKGFVAGCLVTEGKINRNASARLRRGREVVHEGKIGTLKRFKDDANEVRAGLECGIKLDDFNGYETGDVIECFEIQKVRASPCRRSGPVGPPWRPALQRSLSDEQPNRARQRARPTRAQRHPAPSLPE